MRIEKQGLWKYKPDGSFTIEASFVVPLILFAIMAVTAMGMDCAKTLSSQVRVEKQAWEQNIEDQVNPAMVLRIGDEASNILGDVFGTDLGGVIEGLLPNEDDEPEGG